MSKAVMKSVPPRLCEKIANGECTMLLSKTKPKIDTPFKCYIYMTMNGLSSMISVKTKQGFVMKETHEVYPTMANGRVIGEFVCDNIDKYLGRLTTYAETPYKNKYVSPEELTKTCLSIYEINNYLNGRNAYFWHISQLKIYDKPKDLNEFRKPCKYAPNNTCYPDNCKLCPYNYLTSPPQSWCYVEELEE